MLRECTHFHFGLEGMTPYPEDSHSTFGSAVGASRGLRDDGVSGVYAGRPSALILSGVIFLPGCGGNQSQKLGLFPFHPLI